MARILSIAFVVVGCGVGAPPAASWSGTYSGTAARSGTCSDGSAVPPSAGSVVLGITQNGYLLSWQAQCDPFTGFTVTAAIDPTTKGNVATINPATCSSNLGTVTETLSYTSGTLSLNGNAISMTIAYNDVTSGNATVTCTGTLTATLAKK